MDAIIDRLARVQIAEAMADTPVILIKGPRQSGKTTLAQTFQNQSRSFVTLDDETALAGAMDDPVGFMRGLDDAIIDEIQRAPALLRGIKRSVDQDRRAGRFILTGSADLMTLPIVAESLAGRMETVTLYPFATAEILGRTPTFLTSLFEREIAKVDDPILGSDLIELVLIGGYPEMRKRQAMGRRRIWVREYIDALVRRDVRDISEVEKFDELHQLLRVLAQYAGQLINLAALGRNTNLDAKTVHRYIGLLEQLFLIQRISAWHRNDLKRLVKSPKIAFVDSGIVATLRGASPDTFRLDKTSFGPILESFVFSELVKQIAWSDDNITITHFRDKDGIKVDLILENEARQSVGIEIKASATVRSEDFRGIKKFAQIQGSRFVAGYVLYDGENVIPFGDRFFAVPISALWY